jgi:hypothetical protein
LPSITEGPERVHFFEDLVSKTHFVPRDSTNQIARGRKIVLPKGKKMFPGRLFLLSGRALPSITEGPERVHFFEDLVSKTHIVPRDRTNQIARGRQIVLPSCKKIFPGRLFLASGRALPSIPEGTEEDHLFAELVVSSISYGPDDMDWEFTPDVVIEFVVDTTVADFSAIESPESDSAMVDGSIEMELPIISVASIEVPVLRRSKRLAERRLRLHQEKMEVESKARAVVASTCNQVKVPELLGSIFLNGRRRSLRNLKKNVDLDA